MFHPLFMTQTFNLLRGSCQHCHHFLMPGALVVQYTARLLLLEHGLVAESDELELVTLHASKPAPKAKSGAGSGAAEDVGESTGESVPEYKARVWRIMTNLIKRARSERRFGDRDAYKSAIAFDRRKALVAEFLKSANRKKCANCGA